MNDPANNLAKIQSEMIRDLFDAVEFLYGPEGLGKVTERMKALNRAREDRKALDALEDMIANARTLTRDKHCCLIMIDDLGHGGPIGDHTSDLRI